MSNSIITKPELAEIEKSLANHLQSLTGKITNFEDTILADKLKIGLQCLKAHVLFSIPAEQNSRGGRKSNNRVTRDAVSPQGFEGWLAERFHATQHPLKKATAYKWMDALKGLGLDESCEDEHVDRNLAARRALEPVTLQSLCAANVESITAGKSTKTPPNLQQAEFQFLRESLTAYRIQSEGILAIKDQLEAMPEMHKAACARAYATLAELTGTQWAPSDEADELANVNPDSIDL